MKRDSDIPWHLTADSVQYDQKSDQYIATGNVILQKEDRRLTADKVFFNHKQMTAMALGHVVMSAGEDILVGDRLDLDLSQEIGVLYDGSLFYKANHFYIRGSKIRKTGEDSYAMEDGSLTTCDGDKPAWRITGRDLRVTIEGYGTVRHAALWVKNIPVLYTPFLVFPAKLKRQSGLLAPQFGVSERKGFSYTQPFFWAISDSSDATFYWNHMEERGERLGVEYRYYLDPQSKGLMRYGFLEDRKVDDTTTGDHPWGYPEDNYLRPNSDRYWFRMKHDQDLPYGFYGKLDLDIVSDQDYLHEFNTGYMSFEETRQVFLETFGRDIDDDTDTVRTNQMNLNKNWARYSFNADLRWYDDVVARRFGETDTTLQQLPQLTFDAARQSIFGSPVYYDLDSQYTYFYREDGTTGHRTDLHPRFYLPFRLGKYLSVEPSAGFRETAWVVDRYADGSSGKDQTQFREIYDLNLDLTTEIYNVFDVGNKWAEKIKHAVQPRVIYTYIPQVDQDKYPFFDAADRIAAQNIVTYSLTNNWTARTVTTEVGKSPPYAYRYLGRLNIEQSYDIDKARENDAEPFSDILVEAELFPIRYLSIWADALWSPYEKEFTSHNIAATMFDPRGDRLSVEYRYTQSTIESVSANFLVVLTEKLSTFGDFEYNLLADQRIDSSLGFLYNAQCWSLQTRYVEEGTAEGWRIDFLVTLYGLGEFGQALSPFSE